jgi:hypothetical protein
VLSSGVARCLWLSAESGKGDRRCFFLIVGPRKNWTSVLGWRSDSIGLPSWAHSPTAWPLTSLVYCGLALQPRCPSSASAEEGKRISAIAISPIAQTQVLLTPTLKSLEVHDVGKLLSPPRSKERCLMPGNFRAQVISLSFPIVTFSPGRRDRSGAGARFGIFNLSIRSLEEKK